jgi:PAS domain S-box-containing protein
MNNGNQFIKLKNKESKDPIDISNFFELSPDMICIAGSDGFFKMVNASFTRVLGYSEEELLSQSFFNFIHPDDIQDTEREVQKLKSGQPTIYFENRYRRKDGNYIWVLWTCGPDTETGLLYATAKDVTERKKLELNYTLLRRAMNMVDIGIMVLDPSQKEFPITYVNHGIEKMFGYDKNEIIGKKWHYLLGDDIQQTNLQILKEGLNNTRNVETTLRNHRKDGSTFYNTIKITPLLNEAGDMMQCIVIVNDVTMEHQSQYKLKESEQRLSLALEGSDLAFWDWVINPSKFVYSSKWVEMMGYDLSEKEEVLKRWHDLIHINDLSRIERKLNACLSGETFIYDCEFRIKHASGKWIWILDQGKIVEWDENGKPYRMAGTFRDINESKNAYLSLKESNKLINDLNNALDVSNIVAKTDSRGVLIYVNDKLCDISGYNKTELIGNTHNILNSGKQEGKFFRELWATVKKGNIWNGEICNKKKDGTLFWVDSTIVPFLDESGKPSQYICISKDITSRKKTASTLKETNEALSRKLQDFRQFAYITSHNLRAPIANILGLIHNLTNAPKDINSWMPYVKNIGKVAEELDVVVQDMNKILSVRTEQDNRKTTISLEQILKTVLDQLNQELKDSKAIVTADFSNVPKVTLNQSQFTDVLFHLISNSIRFQHPDKDLEINFYASLDKDSFNIEIKDNGIGIDMPKNLNKIFKLYQKFHPGISGKGIGLHMVWQHMEAFGGFVNVESTVGVGTKFILSFPLSIAAESIKIKSVFLIDDDKITNFFHKNMLQKNSPFINICSFLKAKDALDMLKKMGKNELPDLIFLDLNMPEMDGWQFLEALQQFPSDVKNELNVIILSSSIFEEDINQTQNYSLVRNFLSKPLSVNEWKKVVSDFEKRIS